MRIVLAGQPNCGKSTIFNQIAGYKAITSNFPGTTVKYTETKAQINGTHCTCIDLPGTYSITSEEPAEREARRHLLSGEADLIINVADASVLSRSLELTLQLLELGIPMLLCLNMMDEAERKGIRIDTPKLSSILGIPVIPAIATIGKGLKSLFTQATQVWREQRKGKMQQFTRHVEEVLVPLVALLESQKPEGEKVPCRYTAIKLLEKDAFFEEQIKLSGSDFSAIRLFRENLEAMHGVSSEEVISSERHALAMNIFEKVCQVIRVPQKDFRWMIDRWVMHNFFGYFILAAFFIGFFYFIFELGGSIEDPLLGIFEEWTGQLKNSWSNPTLFRALSTGMLQGVTGGVAIVLPYLVPFLIGLSLLEDLGYLPRVAFLMDGFMHRIGLHGKSIIPLILGYGCSVPAVMATRILEIPQHRWTVSILTCMIPCSARIAIIFALVAFFMGPYAALAIFLLNLVVIAVLGKIFAALYPEASLGLILEIPAYQWPPLRNSLQKSWWRMKEFIVLAWPLLIIGSACLAALEYGGVDQYLNWFLSPLTRLLGLPEVVGTTLIFGLMRKELSLIMLTQALGTNQVLTVMTPTQIMVFTVFVTFYIPCLATVAALWKEIGKKGALGAMLLTFFIATVLSLGVRFLGEFLWR
jgi:ferrous iron transport protein B